MTEVSSAIVLFDDWNKFAEAYLAATEDAMGNIGTYTFTGNLLLNVGDGVLIGIKSDKALVLNHTSILSDLADELIVQATKNGLLFKRICYLGRADYRREDIASGNFDNAHAYKLAIGQSFDLDAYKAQYQIVVAAQENMRQMLADASSFAVDESGTLEKIRAEKNKHLVAAFDNGAEFQSAFHELNGARHKTIRLRMHPGNEGYVQSSANENISMSRFKRAFNVVAPIVFAEDYKNGVNRELMDVGGYTVGVKYGNVYIGCQTATIAELRRFAQILGWPVDGTTVAE